MLFFNILWIFFYIMHFKIDIFYIKLFNNSNYLTFKNDQYKIINIKKLTIFNENKIINTYNL